MPFSVHIPESELAVIFGAGASMPLLPNQGQLVHDLWKATTPPYDWQRWPLRKILPARTYLERTFPGMVGAAPLCFEDVVGPLEIAEAEESWFHFAGRLADSRGRATIITNSQVLAALDTWLTVALNPKSLPRKPGDDAFGDHFGPGPHAKVLYARLLHLLNELDILKSCVFVSLNYDLLLDRSILATGQYDTDYRVEAFLDRPLSGVPLPILKLHGSLNWLTCDSCHVLVDLQHSFIGPGSECRYCGAQRARPMLIRPTLLKDFRHRVWQETWREAGRALAGAKRWLIIGYSLPLADVWMLRLLMQSMRSGATGRQRAVVLVDPNTDVLDRFQVLFPQARLGGTSFEEYLVRCQALGHLG
jgi:hypothetical protein